MSGQRPGAKEPEMENEQTNTDWLKSHKMTNTWAGNDNIERKQRQRARGRVGVLRETLGIQVDPVVLFMLC